MAWGPKLGQPTCLHKLHAVSVTRGNTRRTMTSNVVRKVVEFRACPSWEQQGPRQCRQQLDPRAGLWGFGGEGWDLEPLQASSPGRRLSKAAEVPALCSALPPQGEPARNRHYPRAQMLRKRQPPGYQRQGTPGGVSIQKKNAISSHQA